MSNKIMYPFGKADHLTPAEADIADVTIENQLTILEPEILTENGTLNVTVDEEVRDGALLLVKQKTTATETLTFGTGIDAPTITGVAGKTKTQLFMLVSGVFIATGAVVQID